jgi:anthranilate synthase/aminodeoxychorismate synthase-like glutamine amidotransferase
MILIIDNYDSFTYNLVQYVGEMGSEIAVYRNDKISVADIRRMNPEKIILSPGPCTPLEAGVSTDIVREFHKTHPILGVCLGHQAIGEALGGRVVKASMIVHGKTSEILHSGDGLFEGVPSPFVATRYHSLIVERSTLPLCLVATAWTSDGTLMGFRHREYPTFGVQFHPESIATVHGKIILKNFLSVS